MYFIKFTVDFERKIWYNYQVRQTATQRAVKVNPKIRHRRGNGGNMRFLKKTALLFMIAAILVIAVLGVSAADDAIVFDVIDLEGNVSGSGGYVVRDSFDFDGSSAFCKMEIGTDGTANDNTGFDIRVGQIKGFNIHEYPVLKIGYKSNIADTEAVIDLNVGVKYNSASQRLWGMRVNYDRNGAPSEFVVNLKKYSSGSVNPWDWNAVDAENSVEYIRIKPYYQEKQYKSGEYFSVEYVAFFKTEEAANAFDYTLDLTGAYKDIYFREQVQRTVVGETVKLNPVVKPGYLVLPEIVYTSGDPEVCSVDADGNVKALSAGRTTVVGKYGEFTTECEIIVLDKEIAPVEFYLKGTGYTGTKPKVNCLGDSITTYAPGPENGMNYHFWWAKWYEIENRNYGISGTTVTARNDGKGFVQRYIGMDDDADLITVKGGTNDFGGHSKGSANDRNDTTYMGATRLLMEGLIKKYPDKQILFFTPIRRCEHHQTVDTKNAWGDTLNDYASAVEELGSYYGIKVINLYNVPELDFTSEVVQDVIPDDPTTPDVNEYQDAKCASDLMPDGLHPSGKGHIILGEYMLNKMDELGVIKLVKPDSKKLGDIDGNGLVLPGDSIRLARYIAGWKGFETIDRTSADVNSDSVIDTLDYFILARFISGYTGYETLPHN